MILGPPILYANIGWMIDYGGAFPDDRTIGAFGWLKDHDHGAESFNFAASSGKLFGYISGFKGVGVGNLGASRDAEFVEGVTVIWMATDPNSKRKLIVGWYRDATVFRVPQSNATTNARGIPGYVVSADARQATLLRPEFRTFELLSSRVIRGGYGQSPVWYDRRGRYRKDVLAHLDGEELKARRLGKRSPRNNDPEARKIVEQIAVDHAWIYFEAAGYTMKSVERDATGWDLEARAAGKPMLKIEVKGLTGAMGAVELTPNEFDKFDSEKHAPDYILYIVTNCRVGPLPIILRYYPDGKWRTEDGRVAAIERRMAARISLQAP